MKQAFRIAVTVALVTAPCIVSAQTFTPTVAFCQSVVGSGVVNGGVISLYQATNAIPVEAGGFENQIDKDDALERLWTATRNGAWWKLRRGRFSDASRKLRQYERRILAVRGSSMTMERADQLLFGLPANCDLNPASSMACTQYGSVQATACVDRLMGR